MLALATAAGAGSAERQPLTVDRVVASIGNEAITESDVIQEYRFETFLADGRVPSKSPTPPAFKAVEMRLVDQMLLERQLKLDPVKSSPITQQSLQQMETMRKKFRTSGDFEAALRSLRMNQGELLNKLEEQRAILQMIDDRFRPAADADVGSEDIQHYYREVFLPEFARKATGPAPPLSKVQGKIHEILVQKQISELLQEWLTELRRATSVRIISK